MYITLIREVQLNVNKFKFEDEADFLNDYESIREAFLFSLETIDKDLGTFFKK
jgi:hypothetical protein